MKKNLLRVWTIVVLTAVAGGFSASVVSAAPQVAAGDSHTDGGWDWWE